MNGRAAAKGDALPTIRLYRQCIGGDQPDQEALGWTLCVHALGLWLEFTLAREGRAR